jgi:hypothetical protein
MNRSLSVSPGPGEIGYTGSPTGISKTRLSVLQSENDSLRKELLETKQTLEHILEEFILANDQVTWNHN